MKNFIINCLYLLIIFCACKNQEKELLVIPRDTSISTEIAYNTLQLDSNQLEAFILEQELNDTIANGFRNFYNIRNYQYAWIFPDGFTEQTLAFRNLYDYELDTIERKKLDDQLDYWINKGEFKTTSSNVNFRKIELSLTWRYINFLVANNRNLFDESSFKVFPIKKMKTSEAIAHYVKTDPTNELVKTMKLWNGLSEEESLIPSISKKIPLQSNDKIITTVKKRLNQLFQYAASDTTNSYNEDFISLLKKVNVCFGINDSLITPALIQSLNVPIKDRLNQLIVNYERLKWLPTMKTGRQIIVNIPSFVLTAYQDQKKEFDMNVVVGKEGSSTVMFTGEMNNIVFAPYWNIPSSIVQKEILPAMENDKDYLIKNRMEIVNEDKEIPVIRQLPGEQNALGKVKFLFPNSYNIYLHDTPNKEAFKQKKRALSHGCIRVENPVKLAQWILSNHSEWTNSKIDSAMNGDKEKWIKVNPRIPVMIYYLTSYIDSNNLINFREDIYGHDKKFISHLIAN